MGRGKGKLGHIYFKRVFELKGDLTGGWAVRWLGGGLSLTARL